MFSQVRYRLTFLTVGIFLTLYVVSSLAVYTIVRQVVLRGIDNQLSVIERKVQIKNPVNVLNGLPHGVFVLVHNPPASLSYVPSGLEKIIQTLTDTHPPHKRWSAVWTTGTGTKFRVLYLPLPNNQLGRKNSNQGPRYAVIAENVTRELDVLQRLGHVLLFVGAAGVLAATLGGFFLAERALRPIRRAWQRQLEFVADASHELRTPLSVIQSNLGIVLEHSHESIVDNLEWINNAHSEARRLAKLVGDLLTLARSDAQSSPLAVQPLELHTFVSHIVELFEPILDAKRLKLVYESVEKLTVVGDRDRLHQLFVILIDNACKYTPANGTVRVSMENLKGVAFVRIADTGIGISKEELGRVFERFYRSDKARSHDLTGGAGLGLAIAKWIVDAHHGNITIDSQLGIGTTLEVQLPITTP